MGTSNRGRTIADASDPASLLSDIGPFADPRLDEIVGMTLQGLLSGRSRVVVPAGQRDFDVLELSIDGLEPSSHNELDERFSADSLRERGAELPTTSQRLRWGLLNYPSFSREYPRVAHTLATSTEGTVQLVSPVNVLIWALLFPAMTMLLAPLRLRGDLWQADVDLASEWETALKELRTLGIGELDAVAKLQPGSGYASLPTAQKLEAKRRCLDAITDALPRDIGFRLRATALSRLAGAYYSTLRRNGTNTRKRVLKGSLPADLTAACLGDWRVMLEIFGEPLAPDELILTRDPGIDAVPLHLDATSVGMTLIEERVSILGEVWQWFDERHAHSDTTEPPEATRASYGGGGFDPSTPLAARIDRAWGTYTENARSVDRLLTREDPIEGAMRTFGPPLFAWIEVMRTCWLAASGGYYRGSVAELKDSIGSHLEVLKAAGTPIDASLFGELTSIAEQHGFAEQPASVSRSIALSWDEEAGDSPSQVAQISSGFEELREVVNRYRQAWAGQFLERWLEYSWRAPLEYLSREYQSALTRRAGKPPTVKQAATSDVVDFANSWFGGRIEPFFELIGHPREVNQTYRRCMPADTDSAVSQVLASLGIQEREAPPEKPWEKDNDFISIRYDVRRWLVDVAHACERGKDARAPKDEDLEWIAGELATRLNTTVGEAWALVQAELQQVLTLG